MVCVECMLIRRLSIVLVSGPKEVGRLIGAAIGSFFIIGSTLPKLCSESSRRAEGQILSTIDLIRIHLMGVCSRLTLDIEK